MRFTALGRLLGTILFGGISFGGVSGLLGLLPLSVKAAETDRIEYHRDIRPILSDNCFACHGPDASHREADLRLDVSDATTVKASSGLFAIVPGKSHESELIARILSDDSSLKMPPPESNKSLTPEQIEKLRRWIDSGAEYQGHWSFQPIRKPAIPGVETSADVSGANAIDQFVIAELQRHQLCLSPQADAVTLARRLAFDLTGLPPSPEQVVALSETSDEAAYEKLVDELLASPRFGERMAMWWLDLVRYADSVGYHGDQPVEVFPFREWVINAFNENQRFDDFTREQLAGDLLPEPTLHQQIAAGYNRLGMMSREGGAQAKEYLAKYAAERVRNIGGVWLGLTTGCCECHDHKFDPITARDFYRLEAFFADIQEQGVYNRAGFGSKTVVTTPEQDARLALFDQEMGAIQKQIETLAPELAAKQSEWEEKIGRIVDWKPLTPASVTSSNKTTFSIQKDGAILARGPNPDTDSYTLTFSAPLKKITALRLEVLPHDSLPQKGPGRAANGNFVLSEIVASLKSKDGSTQSVLLTNPSASFEQGIESNNATSGWRIATTVDGSALKTRKGWAILPKTGKSHAAVLEFESELSLVSGETLILTLSHNSPHRQHTLGHFRISVTTDPRPVVLGPADQFPDHVRTILKTKADQRTQTQRSELATYYRSVAPLLEPFRTKLAAAQEQKESFYRSLPTMLTTVHVEPRMIRVLPRGNWMDDSGEVVQPGVPEFLPQPPPREGRLTRLDLANWLVSKENPLTARTFVNRQWKLFLGAGLSRKLDDLGAQGDWPTHPRLLNWLAANFIDSGWDVKRLVKQIVMSKTYRQSSVVSSDLQEQDPFNHWLARQGRFRLDAEMIRDNALWIGGLLVEKIGGPSVKPYQPPRYWAYLNFPEREWKNDHGASLYRRGLYTHWQRQYLHPSLLAFDAPSREECTAERVRSNTPLQSLVLLNDPTYVEASRAFAERILRDGSSSPQERLDFAFRRALSRSIKPEESAVLISLLEQHLDQFQTDPDAARELLTVGDSIAASNLDPVELAAWTSIARTILNLHSTITRN